MFVKIVNIYLIYLKQIKMYINKLVLYLNNFVSILSSL